MFSMKSLRNIALSAIMTIGAFSAITYTSCNKDECKDVVCQNGGTCVSGKCSCPYAYEGTNCETQVRTKYYNTYRGNGVDSDGDTYSNWGLKFYQSSDDAKTLGMDLLTNTNMSVAALKVTLQSATTFTVNEQTTAGTTYTGSGTINANTATLTLTAKESGITITFTFANMIKQ